MYKKVSHVKLLEFDGYYLIVDLYQYIHVPDYGEWTPYKLGLERIKSILGGEYDPRTSPFNV